MTSEESIDYFKQYKHFYHSCQLKYPREYSERKFTDLSQAIAIKKHKMPLEIYVDHGMGELNQVIARLTDELSYDTCVVDNSSLQFMRLEPNEALDKIRQLRSVSPNEI